MATQLAEEAAAQHAFIGTSPNAAMLQETQTKHPDAQWFPQAGLGLFLHMGISSVSGECDLSWAMIKQPNLSRKDAIDRWGMFSVSLKMAPAKYWAMAKDFSADEFSPDTILQAARDAGATYAVFTTKHHDGFALWPTQHGGFHIGQYQPGRDLVAEYVAACRNVGLRVGLYYSPPDWYFNQDDMSFNYGQCQPQLDIYHKPTILPERSEQEKARREEAFRAYMRGQVTELLTRYGKIDLIWLDGPLLDSISLEEIRALQPGIVMNTRGHGKGDFKTPECRFPEDKREMLGSWWEYCHVGSDGGWGYRTHDAYKPAGWVLTEFVKARAWGGSFLINYGPDAHGRLPECYYKRMREISEWMAVHKESVSGVMAGCWPERSNVPVTEKGPTWYLHFGYDSDGIATVSGVEPPVSAVLLATGEAVPFTYCDSTLRIEVPDEMRTLLIDVVAVRFPEVTRIGEASLDSA